MVTQTKTLTFEEYLAMPEMKRSYEIIDGELIMAPGPTPDHQWVGLNIVVPLRAFVNERNLGVVLAAPVDVVIQRDPLRTRQPDILYLSAERSGIKGRAELRMLQVFEIPPDLVVEILSPSNTRRDIEDKLKDYMKIGVRECWLVSPEAETVEVLRLSPEQVETVNIYGVSGMLRSEVLEGFTLSIREIFS
ncbi:MAG: Uma2 family endonuclease [Candidatus Tectomicrobia bacterium]|nr:Uma2 family endonuclease [Candidatus Tectomicrobia bacterium]